MLQTLNFVAGGRQIDAKANFFRYETCIASGLDESIRVKADGNDLGVFLPGDSVDLPIFATRWEVVPVTATAVGTVRLGVGKVGSSRLTGVVSITDSERNKTISGQCWRAVASAVGGTGNPVIQVWNNAGSGKNIFVTEVLIGSSSADLWGISTNNNALNTVSASQPWNMNRGGPLSVATLRQDSAAQALTGVNQVAIGYIPATSDRQIIFRRQPMVRPGEGLIIFVGAATSTLRATIEYEEWPI